LPYGEKISIEILPTRASTVIGGARVARIFLNSCGHQTTSCSQQTLPLKANDLPHPWALRFAWKAKGNRHIAKSSKNQRFLRFAMREVALLNFGFLEILKIISRGRHSTSDDAASIFRGKRSTFNTSDGNIAKSSGTEPQVVQPASPKWRKPRKVSLSALQLSFLEEVSHNCCMFVNSTPIFASALQIC
jgi:hypothetical protein